MTQSIIDPASHDRDGARRNHGLSRRQALARLGIASAIAYAVPTLIQLDRAQAHIAPSNCKFQNKNYCK